MERKNKKTKERGNGEGTIYFSETLKKWVAQYVEPSGKRKTLTQRKNEKISDFKKRFNNVMSSINNNSYVENNNITIYELALEIIENKLKRNKIGEASYSREIQTLSHIKNSKIKDLKIQKVTFTQLQDFIDTKKCYSNTYICKIYELLGRTFKEAQKRDYILKNPMLNVEKPKSEKNDKKIEALSIIEQKAFLNALKKETKYKDIFIIALYTGMRMGEILSLQKDDIDFKNSTIHIRRSLTKTKIGKTKLGDTAKTYNSIRDIPITPLIENSLKSAIKDMVLNINNLLFIQSDGHLYSVSDLNTIFKRICVNANLAVIPYIIRRKNKKTGELKEIHSKTSEYNQHMLRHTYATRCIEAGVPAEVLQKLLGHKDIQTTINTYTTIFDKFKNEQINKYVEYIQSIK